MLIKILTRNILVNNDYEEAGTKITEYLKARNFFIQSFVKYKTGLLSKTLSTLRLENPLCGCKNKISLAGEHFNLCLKVNYHCDS